MSDDQQPPLSSFRVRPRFRVRVRASVTDVQATLQAALATQDKGLEVRAFPGLIGLHLAEETRHRWSPRLMLNLEPAADGTTWIEGVYGPEPEVWSVFLYGYLCSGMAGVFSGILGGAQLFTGGHAWAFFITGIAALIGGGLYVAAQLGQKLGAGDTLRLHRAWETAAAGLERSEERSVGEVINCGEI